MERQYLDWIGKAYGKLVADQDIPKLEMKLADSGKISVYRVGDIIRCDIKRPETKRRY